MGDVVVYTDGGCSGNPGPGAWAYVIEWDGECTRASGSEMHTTNNRMELRAVIEALTAVASKGLPAGATVQVFTDSVYVKNGITEWIGRWVRNGWRTRTKEPVKNRDLWERLNGLARELPVKWHWVTGHAGVPRNEECDALVREEIRSLASRGR